MTVTLLFIAGCASDTTSSPRLDATNRAPVLDPLEVDARLWDAEVRPGLSWDVVVVGAGPAGLAAAGDAYEAGARVRVLEREDSPGGSANWSGGLMLFSGTSEQAAAGVADSPETLLAEWSAITGGDTADPWVRRFAEQNIPMVHDLLVERGVVFNGPWLDPSAGVTARVHAPTTEGPGLVSALVDRVPPAALRFGAEATSLAQGVNGRITGVYWTDRATGQVYLSPAHTVIVATGGFLQDLDRVRQERPALEGVDLRHASWTGATGDGLRALEALGAATENLDAVGLYAHAVRHPDGRGEILLTTLGELPWVNAHGARFTDESQFRGFPIGEALAEQPAGEAWIVLDQDDFARSRAMTVEREAWAMSDLLEAGVGAQADSLEALAAEHGWDESGFVDEIAAYNAFARGESADPWRTAAGARVIDMPPFYAFPLALSPAKGFGGVDVDDAGRVLSTEGDVIPGLYAAGELAGMAGGTLVGELGFTGSLTAVILGGRVAGTSAAAEADAR